MKERNPEEARLNIIKHTKNAQESKLKDIITEKANLQIENRRIFAVLSQASESFLVENPPLKKKQLKNHVDSTTITRAATTKTSLSALSESSEEQDNPILFTRTSGHERQDTKVITRGYNNNHRKASPARTNHLPQKNFLTLIEG